MPEGGTNQKDGRQLSGWRHLEARGAAPASKVASITEKGGLVSVRGAASINERAASVSKTGGNSAMGAPPIGRRVASGRKQGRHLHSGGSFVCEGA